MILRNEHCILDSKLNIYHQDPILFHLMAESDVLRLLLVVVCAEHEQLERVENHEQLLKHDRAPTELFEPTLRPFLQQTMPMTMVE